MASARAKTKANPKANGKSSPKSSPKVADKHDKHDRLEKVDTKASAQPEPFRLVSIERTEPPSGAIGKNWFRYNIRQGSNAINGYLQGTATGVKHTAEQIVGQLNERRAGRWGYRTTRAAAPAQSS